MVSVIACLSSQCSASTIAVHSEMTSVLDNAAHMVSYLVCILYDIMMYDRSIFKFSDEQIGWHDNILFFVWLLLQEEQGHRYDLVSFKKAHVMHVIFISNACGMKFLSRKNLV